MPADTNLVFTTGHFLSNYTTMQDGVPANFTTPSVQIGAVGIPVGGMMSALLKIPAYTNVNTGTPGVGAFTRPFMTVIVQGSAGNPATESTWINVMQMHSILGQGGIRPHVPAGTTGAGTVANPIYSNVAVARFGGGPYTNYRLSGQYLGSFPDFSAIEGTLRFGARNTDDELF